MTGCSNVTPARALLDLLVPNPTRQPLSDAVANKAMSDFLADIRALDAKHNCGQSLSQDQLAEQIFRQSPTFKDERAIVPYFRYQLRAALEELIILDREMREPNNGSITYSVLSRFGRILIDYLFDLREILLILKRKETGWAFFDGGKNSGATSWEIFGLARGLALQSTYEESGPPFDHKIAQIASIFVLRQAMELRFERLIAVYPNDRKGKPPKLRHGFHQEFIAAKPEFFQADGFRVKELRHLYDWCSEIVHQAYQPYAWQISMALRRGGDLLRSRSAPATEAWSIFNSVKIPEVEAMQTAYENHFLATYGHGAWKFTRTKPEALVPNWKPHMAFTDDAFRPVLNRPSFCNRIKSGIRRVWESV